MGNHLYCKCGATSYEDHVKRAAKGSPHTYKTNSNPDRAKAGK